jgi:hypothetical protein
MKKFKGCTIGAGTRAKIGAERSGADPKLVYAEMYEGATVTAGWFKPKTARKIAAELIRLADEIEGKA